MKRRTLLAGCGLIESLRAQKKFDELVYWSNRNNGWPKLSVAEAKGRLGQYGRYRRLISLTSELVRRESLPFSAATEDLLWRLILRSKTSISFGPMLLAGLCASSLAWSAIHRFRRSFADKQPLSWRPLPEVFTRENVYLLVIETYGKGFAQQLPPPPDRNFTFAFLDTIYASVGPRDPISLGGLEILSLLDLGNVPGFVTRICNTVSLTEIVLPACVEFQKRGGSKELLTVPSRTTEFNAFMATAREQIESNLVGAGFTSRQIELVLISNIEGSGDQLADLKWLE